MRLLFCRYCCRKRLFHIEDAVPSNIIERLHDAAGPGDLNLDYFVLGPQAEVDRPQARRRITDTRTLVVVLNASLGHHLDARSDSVAIALRSAQRDIKPMTRMWASIHPQFGVEVH